MMVKKQQNIGFSPFLHYHCTRNSNYSDSNDTKQALQFLQGGAGATAGVLLWSTGRCLTSHKETQ